MTVFRLPLAAAPAALAILTALLAAAPAALQAQSKPAAAQDAKKPADDAAQDPKSLEDAFGDARMKVERLEAKLAIAEAKLEVTNLDGDIKEQTIESDLFTKRRAVESASAALVHFGKFEKPTKIQTAEISRDQAKYSAEHAQAELAELEAMYEAEEFAKMTKELVLRRGRRSLEIALRRLEVEKQKLRGLQDELDRETAKREATVRSAEMALRVAELGARKTRMQQRIAVEEAKEGIVQIRVDLEKARKKRKEAEEAYEAAMSADGVQKGGKGAR